MKLNFDDSLKMQKVSRKKTFFTTMNASAPVVETEIEPPLYLIFSLCRARTVQRPIDKNKEKCVSFFPSLLVHQICF